MQKHAETDNHVFQQDIPTFPVPFVHAQVALKCVECFNLLPSYEVEC